MTDGSQQGFKDLTERQNKFNQELVEAVEGAQKLGKNNHDLHLQWREPLEKLHAAREADGQKLEDLEMKYKDIEVKYKEVLTVGTKLVKIEGECADAKQQAYDVSELVKRIAALERGVEAEINETKKITEQKVNDITETITQSQKVIEQANGDFFQEVERMKGVIEGKVQDIIAEFIKSAGFDQ